MNTKHIVLFITIKVFALLENPCIYLKENPKILILLTIPKSHAFSTLQCAWIWNLIAWRSSTCIPPFVHGSPNCTAVFLQSDRAPIDRVLD